MTTNISYPGSLSIEKNDFRNEIGIKGPFPSLKSTKKTKFALSNMSSSVSNTFPRAKAPAVLPETLEAFRGVKENIDELMSYYDTGATKPASKELISALKILKAYSEKVPYWDFVYQVANFSGLKLEKETNEDRMNAMMYNADPEASTVANRNSSKIQFLVAIQFIDHVERILYKESFAIFFKKTI